MLRKILHYKKEELAYIKSRTPLPEVKSRAKDAEDARNFPGAIARPENNIQTVNIIGEIKKASPSLGKIRDHFDPVAIAQTYEQSGIAAISVLTDEYFFQGKKDYLPLVKKVVTVPVLRKDFIFDEYQIYESAAFSADAILLIAAVLDKNQLADYICLSNELNLHTLVEIHNTTDMEKALHAENILSVIGINNRNLETFTVDTQVTVDLIKKMPKDKIIVSESGIKEKGDIRRLLDAGVHAFLIGETFMKEENISKKVAELRDIQQ